MHLGRFTTRILALLVLLTGLPVKAEVYLEDSRIWRRARVIAPGQHVWSFQTSYEDSSNRFGANGSVQPIGQTYARAVTWGQLVKADSLTGSSDVPNYMRQIGAHSSDVAATSAYQVNREDVGLEMNWAYGLTRSWMIGVRLPVTHRTLRVHETVQMSAGLSNGLNRRAQSSILGQSARGASDRVAALAQTELMNSGYDRIPARQQTWDWGDVSLLSQESLYHSYRWHWSFQQLLRFPTSQSPNLDDYIQVADDSGQVDLGASSLLDYQRGHWLVGFRLGYVAQLPDTTRMRVPTTDQGSQLEPTVRRDLGDWMWSSADTEYHVARHWDLSAEHSFLSKGRDRYRGDAQNGVDYAALAQGTDQQLQQTRLGVLYRVVPASVREGLLNGWTTSLDFTYPWLGRNSTDASKASLEVISYF